MAAIILFHSVLGLRDSERVFEERLRAAGHTVIVPDLYAGAATDDLGEGFEIKDRIGWDTIRQRAGHALAAMPEDAVLAGISMGAGVVAEFWGSRPLASRVLLLHGLANMPPNTRPGIPVQMHVARQDPFFPEEEVRAWQETARAAGADAHVFRYPDAGHYFSDAALPDYNDEATALLWTRLLAFLA